MNRISRMTVSGLAAACLIAGSALAQPFCLTTSFASNDAWAGNMFDIEPKRNIDLTRWQVNVSTTEMVTIEIYWREGSYRGHEYDPSAWTLLGSATTQGQGTDYPTSINVGDLPVYEDRVYGIYVHLASYQFEIQHLRWVRGEPTVFENDDLRLTTGVGMRYPAFSGGAFENKMWSGTVCYEDARPLIAIDGECPGRLTLWWDRCDPGFPAGLCFGLRQGRFVIPDPCQGTELGIAGNLRLVRVFRTGPEGRGRMSGPVTQEYCGGYLQILVVGPCITSNVVQVPQ